VITSWNNEVWNDTLSNVIEAVYNNLNIPIMLFYLMDLKFESSAGLYHAINSYDQVCEHAAESSQSYLIISYSNSSACLHMSNYVEYPQSKWTPKDKYMILVILHSSWHDCKLPQSFIDLFKMFWTNYRILNVITMVKYLNT
jgi:hypothetical protein